MSGTHTMPTTPRALLLLIPLLLLMTALAVPRLDMPIWFDEHATFYISRVGPYGPTSFGTVWQGVAGSDFQTPGYYLIYAAWTQVAGLSPLVGRALSLLAGLLTVAFSYRLGRDLISPLGGLASALMVGTSAFFINYTYEMRVYLFTALLAAAALWMYWRLISSQEGPSWRGLSALALVTAAVCYTHYFASITIMMIGLYHLLFVHKDARWWHITAALIAGGLLFLPWGVAIIGEIAFIGENPGKVRPLSLDTRAVIQNTMHFFSNGSIALFGLLAFYGLARRDRPLVFIWFTALGALGIAVGVNLALGVLFSIRHISFLWPMLALVAAAGVDRLARVRGLPALILGIWLMTGVGIFLDPVAMASLRQPFAHLHWRAYSDALRAEHLAPDATTIYLLPYPAQEPLHRQVADFYLRGVVGTHHLAESPRLIGEAGFEAAMRRRITEAGPLWVGHDPHQPPDYLFELDHILIDTHIICAAAQMPDLRMNYYAPLPDDFAPRLQFGGGVALDLLLPVSASAPDRLAVAVGLMRAPDFDPAPYSVALHVLDAAGALVAQADFGLPAETLACHRAELSLGGLNPGAYTLHAIVYRWADGDRLAGIDTASGESSDSLPLATFTLPGS